MQEDSNPIAFYLKAVKEVIIYYQYRFFSRRTYIGELKLSTKVIPSKLIWNITNIPPAPDITLQIVEKGIRKDELEYDILVLSKEPRRIQSDMAL